VRGGPIEFPLEEDSGSVTRAMITGPAWGYRRRVRRSDGAGSTAVHRFYEVVQNHRFGFDALVAAGAAAAAILSARVINDEISRFEPGYDRPSELAVTAMMLAATIPLAWRRHLPLVVVCVVTAAFIASQNLFEAPETTVTSLTTLLAIYSAAAYGRSPLRAPLLAGCIIAILLEIARQLFIDTGDVAPAALTRGFLLAYNAVVFTLPWTIGALVRSLRRRQQDLAERAVELQQQREENARRAVLEERVRIARELHDVVAHHVSVMGIQAGAARRVMDRQPERRRRR
jgi:signal transduction histidine kinase